MPNSKQIVYLSQAQYAELIANGTITVDGVTVTYDENDIYVTPQAEPVTDVRVAGTSVAANGVANIPIATTSTPGVVQPDGYGLWIDGNNKLAVKDSSEAYIKSRYTRPITAYTQHMSTFYGLAYAAGDTTQFQSSNSVGTYTPEAKGAIQSMLGVSDLIATAENNLVASKAYAIGDVFTANGKLYKATAAIAQDAAIITDGANANCEETSVGEGFVKFTDLATSSTAGVVKLLPSGGQDTGLAMDSEGRINTQGPTDNNIKLASSRNRPITPYTQHKATFYGLAKAAGDTTQAASDNAVGTYTDNAKSAIRSMIGAVGTSDYANATVAGVVKVSSDYSTGGGIGISSNGMLSLETTTDAAHKNGTATNRAVLINKQHSAVFYGLAKAAGDTTQSTSSNAIGNYTPEAKAAIWEMLGLDGSAFIKSEWELIREDTFTNETEASHIITEDKDGNSFALTDLILMFETPKQDTYAEKGTYGQVHLYCGNTYYNPEPGAWTQGANTSAHAAFYIVEQRDGLTFISHTAQTTATNSGALRYRYSEGFKNVGNGIQVVPKRSFNKIVIPTVTGTGHYILYGKRERYNMDSAIVNISSTTPTITALPGHRYVCGEVTSLNVTPPSAGCIDILFTSGSTVTVLTVPNTVVWPEWFDPDNLETNCTYEINIMDGKYGVVTTWPMS